MKVLRQGDVLIIIDQQIEKTPVSVEETERPILAYGEVTGHCHVVDKPGKVYSFGASMDRLLELHSPARLLHEEHAPIDIPAGKHIVRIQREYSPEEVRNVQD